MNFMFQSIENQNFQEDNATSNFILKVEDLKKSNFVINIMHLYLYLIRVM